MEGPAAEDNVREVDPGSWRAQPVGLSAVEACAVRLSHAQPLADCGPVNDNRLKAALHAAYRSTGADLPFADPRADHGARMEGYYWRLTEAASGRVLMVLCGLTRLGAERWAVVALAAQPGGFLRSAIAPVASGDPRRLAVRAGDLLEASASELRVDLGEGARLHARLAAAPGWTRRAFGGSGPGQLIPWLPQYWHAHLLGAAVTGEAELGSERFALAGARAYAEKNWGGPFPGDWWWGQAHDFSAADACVAFAGGRVGPARSRVAPTAVVVRVEDRLVRLAPPFAVVRSSASAERWRVHTRGALWSVEIEAEAAGCAPHLLPVPLAHERRCVPRSQQVLAGRLEVVLRRGRRVVFRGDSPLAGLERGSPT